MGNSTSNIRLKLLVLSLAGVLPAMVAGFVAYRAISTLNRKAEALVASSTFLSNHWEGDMLHDDLRGDLYALLAAGSETEREAARAMVRLDAGRFRVALEQNRKLASFDPEVDAELKDLRPELVSYINEAEALAGLLENDRQDAIRALHHFEQAYQALDRRQDKLNRLIMNRQEAAEKDSRQTVEVTKRQMLAIVLFAALALGAAAWLLARWIWGPMTVGMQTILAQSNIIGVFRGNDKGEFVEANDAFLSMFGYSRQDLEAGKIRWDDMAAPESRTASLDLATQLAQNGTTQPTELECIRKDGTRVPVVIGLASIDPRNREAVGFVFDLTKTQVAQNEALASGRRLQAIVDSLDDFVAEMDASGTYVNVWARNEAALIRPKNELIGRNCKEFLDGDLLTSVLETIQRVLATGRSEEMEYSLEIAGMKRWFLARFNPLVSNAGRYETACLVVRDTTNRKEAQEALLRAAQAAELANRAKSEFLANMSHEIRTPLHGILGTLDAVLESDLDRGQREYLEMTKTSAESLLGILNDILDLSKIEAGKVELERVDFGPVGAVARVTQLLAQRAHQKGLQLTWDVSSVVPQNVQGDEGRLRQVLTNLAGNAIKFTERGEIGLHVTVDNIQEDRILLHFLVRDTGIGIPEEKQQAIFEAFSQADASTTRRFGGTGLGLTISSRLVELMGGRMWVKSAPGQGSEFHFTALFHPAACKSAAPGSPVPVPARFPQPLAARPDAPLRVLLVEDNPINVKVAIGLLEKRGHAVAVAHTGYEAIQSLERGVFDAVLMDINMPELDGLAATLVIREKEKKTGRHVPIIAMTAGAMKSDEEKCLAAGMDAYISKPFEPKALYRTLETTAERFAIADTKPNHSTGESSAPFKSKLA